MMIIFESKSGRTRRFEKMPLYGSCPESNYAAVCLECQKARLPGCRFGAVFKDLDRSLHEARKARLQANLKLNELVSVGKAPINPLISDARVCLKTFGSQIFDLVVRNFYWMLSDESSPG